MTAAANPAREREPANAWDKFLELVKSRVSINTYTTWFQPTRLSRADGDNLYVQIPSTVFRQVLTRTYGEIARQIGKPAAVRAVGAANGRNPYNGATRNACPASVVWLYAKAAQLGSEWKIQCFGVVYIV